MVEDTMTTDATIDAMTAGVRLDTFLLCSSRQIIKPSLCANPIEVFPLA
jgi:hypothetical protein